MPHYLPLCAIRQGLLPAACSACAWWQTSGAHRLTARAASEMRRDWMVSLESAWGSTGILALAPCHASELPRGEARRVGNVPALTRVTLRPVPSVTVASINFAPSPSVARLRELPFTPLPGSSAFLFCLITDEHHGRPLEKRVLQKALGQLKSRGIDEAYALAAASSMETSRASAGPDGECCFFAADLLDATGFEAVEESGGLRLMRADLRGLLSLLGQVESAVRRALGNEPAPSPAAWTHRGA